MRSHTTWFGHVQSCTHISSFNNYIATLSLQMSCHACHGTQEPAKICLQSLPHMVFGDCYWQWVLSKYLVPYKLVHMQKDFSCLVCHNLMMTYYYFSNLVHPSCRQLELPAEATGTAGPHCGPGSFNGPSPIIISVANIKYSNITVIPLALWYYSRLLCFPRHGWLPCQAPWRRKVSKVTVIWLVCAADHSLSNIP